MGRTRGSGAALSVWYLAKAQRPAALAYCQKGDATVIRVDMLDCNVRMTFIKVQQAGALRVKHGIHLCYRGPADLKDRRRPGKLSASTLEPES